MEKLRNSQLHKTHDSVPLSKLLLVMHQPGVNAAYITVVHTFYEEDLMLLKLGISVPVLRSNIRFNVSVFHCYIGVLVV